MTGQSVKKNSMTTFLRVDQHLQMHKNNPRSTCTTMIVVIATQYRNYMYNAGLFYSLSTLIMGRI